jgi:hypothetical protein
MSSPSFDYGSRRWRRLPAALYPSGADCLRSWKNGHEVLGGLDDDHAEEAARFLAEGALSKDDELLKHLRRTT